jgi:hypothetical protein
MMGTLQEIIDLLGLREWSDVYSWFGSMGEAEVLAELNRVYPGDNNEALSASIARGVKYYGEEGPHWRAEF